MVTAAPRRRVNGAMVPVLISALTSALITGATAVAPAAAAARVAMVRTDSAARSEEPANRAGAANRKRA
jgi:hypothetical protein